MGKLRWLGFTFLAFLFLGKSAIAFQTPENNTRDKARAIDLGLNGNYISETGAFSAQGATGDGILYDHWGDKSTRNVWFQFKAPQNDKMIFSVEAIEKGTPKAYIQLAVVDKDGKTMGSYALGFRTNSEKLVVDGLRAGENYFLTVDNPTEGDELGAFTLGIQTFLLSECSQPFTVVLDENGKGSVSIEDLLTEDCYWPCAGPGCSKQIEILDFDCDDLGEKYITIKGEGADGKKYLGTSLIQVADETNPTILAKPFRANITNGNFVDVDPKNVIVWRCKRVGSEPEPAPSPGTGEGGGSFFQEVPCSKDNCGIAKYELSKTRFTCDDLGENEVIARVVDKSGNEATTTVIITIYDATVPVAKAKNITVNIDERGIAEVDPKLLDAGSTAGCSGLELSLNKSVFNYNDLGKNEVNFMVKNGEGKMASAKAEITVKDVTAPTVVTKADTMYLNREGKLEINTARNLVKFCNEARFAVVEQPGFTPDGSATLEKQNVAPFDFSQACTTDNGLIYEAWTEKREFATADLGENEVKVFVSDMGGNTASAMAKLTIMKSEFPCAKQLYAIRSGNWNDPNIWSDKPNGQPIGTIPCEQSFVTIAGQKVEMYEKESLKIQGLSLVEDAKKTELNILSGGLIMKEEIVKKGNVQLRAKEGQVQIIKN